MACWKKSTDDLGEESTTDDPDEEPIITEELKSALKRTLPLRNLKRALSLQNPINKYP